MWARGGNVRLILALQIWTVVCIRDNSRRHSFRQDVEDDREGPETSLRTTDRCRNESFGLMGVLCLFTTGVDGVSNREPGVTGRAVSSCSTNSPSCAWSTSHISSYIPLSLDVDDGGLLWESGIISIFIVRK